MERSGFPRRRWVLRLATVALALGVVAPGTATEEPPEVEWRAIFGGEGTQAGASVAVLEDGGMVLGGIDVQDMMLIRIAADGRTLWKRTYGGGSRDYGTSVQATSDGGFVLAGRSESFGAGGFDYYVVKTDADGTPEWERTYGGASGEFGHDVRETTDGGFVVAGWTESFGAEGRDFFLVKADGQGEVEWQSRVGEAGDDLAHGVCETSDGGYVVAGCFGNRTTLARFLDDGRLFWVRSYDFDRAAHCAAAVCEARSGDLLVAGWLEGTGSAGAKDFLLLRTDAEGEPLWRRVFGHGGNDYSESLQETEDGGIVVAGILDTRGDDGKDMYVVRTDAEGSLLWEGLYGGEGLQWASNVQLTPDHGMVVAGNTEAGPDVDGLVIRLRRDPALDLFVRCDANSDGEVDISDGIWTLQQIFREGPAGSCESASDCNDDGVVDITDAIYGFRYRLLGGPVPSLPFPACGVDPSSDPLSCQGAAPCD